MSGNPNTVTANLTVKMHQTRKHAVRLDVNNNNWYHPTSGLMEILHFNWLHYSRTISNSPRAPSSVMLSFSFSPKQIFLQLTLANFLIAISVRLVG